MSVGGLGYTQEIKFQRHLRVKYTRILVITLFTHNIQFCDILFLLRNSFIHINPSLTMSPEI